MLLFAPPAKKNLSRSSREKRRLKVKALRGSNLHNVVKLGTDGGTTPSCNFRDYAPEPHSTSLWRIEPRNRREKFPLFANVKLTWTVYGLIDRKNIGVLFRSVFACVARKLSITGLFDVTDDWLSIAQVASGGDRTERTASN